VGLADGCVFGSVMAGDCLQVAEQTTSRTASQSFDLQLCYGDFSMRICHVWHSFQPWTMGGVERYILTLSNYLSGSYPEIQSLLITDNTEYPYFKSRKLPKHEQFEHLGVYRFGPNSLSVCRGFHYRIRHHDSQRLVRMLTSKLYKEMANTPEVASSDIFHVHGLWGSQYPTVGLQLSQRFNKPLVVSLHGDSVGTEYPHSMPLEKSTFANMLTKASAITTYSQTVLASLHKMGFKHKSYLIPNFINTAHFKRPFIADNSSAGKRVVMVCRLDPFKDPLTAVEAFALVAKVEPKATLQIVGDGPLFEPMKRLIEELGLENNVFLMGQHVDVRPFLWGNDIFLTGNAFLSVLEAWSAGLGVVAANGETTGKLIDDGKNGLLVQPKNPQQLASALLQIMRDKPCREAFVKRGFETAVSYDISNSGEKFFEIYDSISDTL
jgi:glycosyltransferase involved in cell wall biosynthesis